MANKGVNSADDLSPRVMREIVQKKFLDEVIGSSGYFHLIILNIYAQIYVYFMDYFTMIS